MGGPTAIWSIGPSISGKLPFREWQLHSFQLPVVESNNCCDSPDSKKGSKGRGNDGGPWSSIYPLPVYPQPGYGRKAALAMQAHPRAPRSRPTLPFVTGMISARLKGHRSFRLARYANLSGCVAFRDNPCPFRLLGARDRSVIHNRVQPRPPRGLVPDRYRAQFATLTRAARCSSNRDIS